MNNKVDITTPGQKVFAVILLLFVIGAIGSVLFYILPPIVEILKNLWLVLLYGLPLLLITLYVMFNPLIVWMTFKNVSWKITKMIIGIDRIGILNRYHEALQAKLNDLISVRNEVSAVEKTLIRRLTKVEEDLRTDKSIYQHAPKGTEISPIAHRVAINTKLEKDLSEQVKVLIKKRIFLDELVRLWRIDNENLGFEIKVKIQEFESLHITNAALTKANSFLKIEDEGLRVFNEGLKQLEERATIYMANIEDFENTAKPIIAQKQMAEAAMEAEGRRILDEYKKNRTF